jgi:hypothetical protein
MIKTFRGRLVEDSQNKIRLSTKKGKIGYKILKFEIMPQLPHTVQQVSVVQVFKVDMSANISGTVDFSDGNLLAAAIGYFGTHSDPQQTTVTMFEQEVFNQDIFITHLDVKSNQACNYYLELEVMNLSENATIVSTLRDIRLNPQVGA